MVSLRSLLVVFFSLVAIHPLWADFLLTNDPIDVVIPCHPKDAQKLPLAIEGARKNIENLGRFFVVSKEPLSTEAEWIDETKLSFYPLFSEQGSKYPIESWGWTFQQLVKLSVFEEIPDLSPNVFVLDADTIFLNRVKLMEDDGTPYYHYGTEYHKFYFSLMAKLIPGLGKVFPNFSGIAHCMLFQRPVMKALFSEIREHHGLDPIQAILLCHHSDYPASTQSPVNDLHLSEYEIYFNYLFSRTEQAKIRPLNWKNVSHSDPRSLAKYKKEGYHYVSHHHYMSP